MDGSVSETSVVCQVLQYREMLCGVVWVIYSFLPDSVDITGYKMGACFSIDTLMEVVSLLSSCTTAARASGFTPASSSCTQIWSVSLSRRVFSKSDISFIANMAPV